VFQHGEGTDVTTSPSSHAGSIIRYTAKHAHAGDTPTHRQDGGSAPTVGIAAMDPYSRQPPGREGPFHHSWRPFPPLITPSP
jgi:hypothetical protein